MPLHSSVTNARSKSVSPSSTTVAMPPNPSRTETLMRRSVVPNSVTVPSGNAISPDSKGALPSRVFAWRNLPIASSEYPVVWVENHDGLDKSKAISSKSCCASDQRPNNTSASSIIALSRNDEPNDGPKSSYSSVSNPALSRITLAVSSIPRSI